MSNRGRPRKSVGQHKQEGTWRPDRHEGILEDVPTGLKKPRGLDKAGSWLWDRILAGLPQSCFGSIDIVALTLACRLWSHLQATTPEDVTFYKAEAALDRILSRYGWTPADRAKLKAPQQAEDDDTKRFFGVAS